MHLNHVLACLLEPSNTDERTSRQGPPSWNMSKFLPRVVVRDDILVPTHPECKWQFLFYGHRLIGQRSEAVK